MSPQCPQYIVWYILNACHSTSTVRLLIQDTVDGSEILNNHVYTTNNGINYQPQLVNAGFLPSTVVPPSMSASRQLSSLWGRSAVLTSPPTSCWATARRGTRDLDFFRWKKGSPSENSGAATPKSRLVVLSREQRVNNRAIEGGLSDWKSHDGRVWWD